ncbi:hypothetical protein Q5P01_021016 [Channa striata]|uniref:Uncharacterized protein n=1 Tax=Channa striata TaxID=64152 RepID=A0AA88LYT0_CHASR|nr:hypothetical protein Q5P01_021016 [Channa striata]
MAASRPEDLVASAQLLSQEVAVTTALTSSLTVQKFPLSQFLSRKWRTYGRQRQRSTAARVRLSLSQWWARQRSKVIRKHLQESVMQQRHPEDRHRNCSRTGERPALEVLPAPTVSRRTRMCLQAETLRRTDKDRHVHKSRNVLRELEVQTVDWLDYTHAASWEAGRVCSSFSPFLSAFPETWSQTESCSSG